jgi:hypothetical protein
MNFESKPAGLTSSTTSQEVVAVSGIHTTPFSLEKDAGRSGLSICNTSDKDIYILVGNSTPSLDNLTAILPAYTGTGGTLIYETPFGYSGPVTILAESSGGTGNMILTYYQY